MRPKRARAAVRHNSTRHRAIVAANTGLLRTLPNVPWDADLARICWACGNGGPAPYLATRAHVVARRFSGRDEPGNYFLLCDLCHDEQPDAASRELQVDWLRNRDSCRVRNLPKVAQLVEWLEAHGIDLDKANEYVRGAEIRAALRSSGCGVHGVADVCCAIVRQHFIAP